jgi:hypothetical protein
MARLGTALAASSATLADVLKTTLFVTSAQRADLVIAWEVIRAAFGDHDAPSTLLGDTVLGYPDQLVEIEAVAAASKARKGQQPLGQKARSPCRRIPSGAGGGIPALAAPRRPRRRQARRSPHGVR